MLANIFYTVISEIFYNLQFLSESLNEVRRMNLDVGRIGMKSEGLQKKQQVVVMLLVLWPGVTSERVGILFDVK